MHEENSVPVSKVRCNISKLIGKTANFWQNTNDFDQIGPPAGIYQIRCLSFAGGSWQIGR